MNIVYGLLDSMAVIIEVTMWFVFVASFIEDNIIRDHIAGVVVTTILDFIFNYITVQIAVYSIYKSIVHMGIVLFAQFVLYRKYYDRIFVMTVTYMLFLTLIDYSTVAVMTYLSAMEFGYFQKMTAFRIYGTVISKGFLMVSVFFIRKKLSGLKRLQRSYLFFICGISGTILLFAFYMFQNFMQRNQISGSETMMFTLLLLIEILSFYSFAAITEKNEKEGKLHLMNLHNQMLQESLEEEKDSFALWSGRVHDYKNHVIYMLELLEAEEYKKLKEYMQEEAGILKYQYCYVQSGYEGIDAILNSKMVHAKSQDIHVFCNISIPKGLSLDEGAMVTILGNLLDNAIRAELLVEEKLIEVNINYMKDNLYIKIVNHKGNGKIDFETSSKENSRWHGIGLRSVKQQVRKLNGDFKLIQKKDKVIAIAVIYELGKESAKSGKN